MVRATLVKDWIELGRRLTEALDRANFEVVASFWFYDQESDEWRLIIASPIVDDEGPLEAYRTIQRVLGELDYGELSLNDISVVSPTHDLVSLLRIAFHTGNGISGIRFTRNRINDQFIEDAYIYRVM